MSGVFEIPHEMEQLIERELKEIGYSLHDPRGLAKAIQGLSDFYIHNPQSPTPWTQTAVQAAYLSYFFPLNALRSWSVTEEGHRFDFFKGLQNVVDFGSGLGAGSWWLAEIENHTYIESADLARKLHQRLSEDQKCKSWLPKVPPRFPAQSLGLFSYSLTELNEIPAWALSLEALMIVEPSTRDDGRKLLHLRQQLLDEGFHIWAPCTHQKQCPLLKDSLTDWCHDRIHFKAPDWFLKIEALLPFKNQTLTMSYLLARKSPPPSFGTERARLTGDRLNEKGKSRQLVCRSDEREFLSWLHRDGEPVQMARGELIEFPTDYEKKSNEIRPKSEIKRL